MRVPSSSHHAQTDVPVVFEHGPLACIYMMMRGGAPDDRMLSAKEALRAAIADALEPLLEERWLAIGLAPLGG